jgi:hypothetical protein
MRETPTKWKLANDADIPLRFLIAVVCCTVFFGALALVLMALR